MRYCATVALLFAAVDTVSAVGAEEAGTAHCSNTPGVVRRSGSCWPRRQYPGGEQYEKRIESYWSVTAQVRPWCLIQPQDASEVSRIVVALKEANKTEQCQFAVRSGGHTTWPGANNIVDGVTIDLGLINATTVFNNGTAGVGPGSRWGHVYDTLAKDNLMVVGARSYSVGVGGFLLGGGNSFYSGRKGLACDNVVQFELVLGSGEIIYVNKNSFPDLFQALKGSSNNLGIVTRFDLATFDDEKLWGGVVAYPFAAAETQMEYLENFTNKVHEDPYASVIMILNYDPAIGQIVVANAYEYTRTIDPASPPEVLKEFLSIPGNISDTMRVTNISDLVEELDQATGYRNSWMTVNFQNDAEVMKYATKRFNAFVERLKNDGGDWISLTLFQPLPSLFTQHSMTRGGNVLGLDSNPDNLILFLAYCGWKDAEKDSMFEDAQRLLIAEITAFAESKGKGHPHVYLPYARYDQQPLEGYGAANIEKIREVARKYDPEGVFQTMVPGGFKISRVGTTKEGSADTKVKKEQDEQVKEREISEEFEDSDKKDEL